MVSHPEAGYYMEKTRDIALRMSAVLLIGFLFAFACAVMPHVAWADDEANPALVEAFDNLASQETLLEAASINEADSLQVAQDAQLLEASASVEETPDRSSEDAALADGQPTGDGAASTDTVEDATQESASPQPEATAETSLEATVLQIQSPSAAPFADGDYIIRSTLTTSSVLDVAGGSKASGANVQLYSWNGTNAQKWKLTYDSASGFYTIASLVSGNVLDVSGASTSNGANVQVYAPNGTKAQQWRIVADGSGWRIESALKSSFVLDISGAGTSDGTNAQAYTANGTAAQRFDLIALSPSVAPSTATVAEGAYVLKAGTGKVVDVSGGSRASGANVQQYESNSTYAQRFYLEPDGTGFYRIFNIGSGLALDVAGAGLMPGTNVWQYDWNGTNAQLWSLRANADGTVTLISKANGLALDVSGASTSNGANLQVYTSNGTKAQKFTLIATDLLSAGPVTLYSSASIGRVIDVAGASEKSGAALQLYDSNGTNAQRLVASKTGSGYTLRPVCSMLYASVSGTACVQTSDQTVWTISYAKSGARRGIVFTTGGKVITASSVTNGSPLKLSSASGSEYQSFCPVSVTPFADGVYTIASANGGRVLDIAGGSWDNGANVQIYTANDTGAQAFRIESAGNGYYRITNAMTFKVVDVAGAKNANGTNVQQYDWNGTGAQLWKAEFTDDGFVVFTNKATGKVLEVNGGKNADGANVDIWTRTAGSKSQEWSLKSSSYKGDPVLVNAYNMVQGRSSDTSYYIMVDLSNTRTMIFQGSQGNWTPIKNWVSSVGAPESSTPTGYFTISGRGYSFDGALGGTPYTCYYWTNFQDGIYLFHSIPYYQGTWTVQDGRIGGQISHGCVRLATDNAQWINYNIPDGTEVYIYY